MYFNKAIVRLYLINCWWYLDFSESRRDLIGQPECELEALIDWEPHTQLSEVDGACVP